MTGPKLNEKATVVGERSGTRATAKYVRSSASKARVVLDLIRGIDVRTADQVLQFTERHIARDVRKVLASAVANAVANDLQDPDELYVVACFADEGPTLRRFRPRARGRASRINKRSCHITVIVARMSDERLAIVQAREVLDLIRGIDVRTADQVLQFTERHIAHDVRKVLASAVANAVNNDLQEVEELYVVACYADEGPTLKRFRPRARGRASRINKRSCHITVIVARMSDDRIAIVQARAERAGGATGRGRPQSSAASRRARVARSRGEDPEETTEESTEAADESTEDTTTGADVDQSTDAVAAAEGSDEAGDSADQTDTAATGSEDESVVKAQWAGSVEPLEDAKQAPEGYEIKGNAGSMLYHEPGSRYYNATKAEVWFDSVESAEAAGFTKPGSKTATAKADDAESATAGDAAEAKKQEDEAKEEDTSMDSSEAAEGSASDEAGSEAVQPEGAETDGKAEEN